LNRLGVAALRCKWF